jgi:hypothetical protein
MTLIREPLSSDGAFSRIKCLDSWFAPDRSSDVKLAALAYLGDCGLASDLQTIRSEFDRNDYKTVSPAAEAIIRINLRDSCEKGMEALYELQPESVSRDLLNLIFEKATALNTDTLLAGLGHRSVDVRRMVVKLLYGRKALPIQAAEDLSHDSDAKIRYYALQSRVAAGTYSQRQMQRRSLLHRPLLQTLDF